MRVDLPAPFSPTMEWISSWRTVNDTSASALTPGNSLVMLRISSRALVGRLRFGHRVTARRGAPANTGPLCRRCVTTLSQLGVSYDVNATR